MTLFFRLIRLATLGHIIHRPADIIWRLVRISNLPPSCPFVCPADGSILRLEKKKTPIDIDLNAQKVRNPVIYLKMIQFPAGGGGCGPPALCETRI
jgi:hypothetical protein